MENIKSFLESRINEASGATYVVCIGEYDGRGPKPYMVEDWYGPLTGDVDETNKIKKVLGKHEEDQFEKVPCEVKIMGEDELLKLLKTYNGDTHTNERDLRAQSKRSGLTSFLSMFD